MPDKHANFAISTITALSGGSSTPTTYTSITVADGSVFPAASFNAIVCPAGQLATASNAEIVRVTAVSTNVLTVTRGPLTSDPGGVNRAIQIGDQIYAGLTVKSLTDVERVVSASRAYPTVATTTLSSGAWTAIALTTPVSLPGYDSNGNIQSGQYVCPATGYYLAIGSVASSGSSPLGGGSFGAGISHNGTYHTGQLMFIPGSVTGTQAAICDTISCATGDTLGLGVYWQSSGGNYLANTNAAYATYMSVAQLI